MSFNFNIGYRSGISSSELNKKLHHVFGANACLSVLDLYANSGDANATILGPGKAIIKGCIIVWDAPLSIALPVSSTRPDSTYSIYLKYTPGTDQVSDACNVEIYVNNAAPTDTEFMVKLCTVRHTMGTPIAKKDITSDYLSASDLPTVEAIVQRIKAMDSAKVNKSAKSTITLLPATWTGASAPYTYQVTGLSCTADSMIEVVFPTGTMQEMIDAWIEANIIKCDQATGTVTFYANGIKPSINITIQLVVRND